MPSFRAKARAVDLLGKGQIADLPTSITELWKNGYDAYADQLVCDLYLKGHKGLRNSIFLLWDNGIGMSRKDIEEKWIVLGTDSKFGASTAPPELRMGKPPRTQMGEKGIGRLSVAYLGPRMLMLTRNQNSGVCNALYMDWRALDNPHLYLDEINIPLGEVTSLDKLNDVFKRLLNEFRQNLSNEAWNKKKNDAETISKGLSDIDLPDIVINERIAQLFSSDGHGTMFVIFDPVDLLIEAGQQFGELKKNDVKESSLQYLRSSLCGMSNSFVEKAKPFEYHFWVHKESKAEIDIVARDNFFELADLEKADHCVCVEFDETGTFVGHVRAYKKTEKYSYHAIRPNSAPKYGPFKLKFWYVEGLFEQTQLSKDDWGAFNNRLDLFGGLYIYRDGFRVLPYGRTEYDFLKLEERRSRRLGSGFSYRRMVGYIEIGRDENPTLKDKAGREGLIVNNAYRQFVEDLIGLFDDLMKRYFRTDADTLKSRQLEDIKKLEEKTKIEEDKKIEGLAKEFRKKLKTNGPAIDALKKEIEVLNNELNGQVINPHIDYQKISSLMDRIVSKKNQLGKMFIAKPKRFDLTTEEERRLSDYTARFYKTEKVLDDCEQFAETIKTRLPSDSLKDELIKQNAAFRNDLASTIENYRSLVDGASESLVLTFGRDIARARSDFLDEYKTLNISPNDTKENLERKITESQKLFENAMERFRSRYEPFIEHLQQLTLDVDEDLLTGYYRGEMERAREQLDAVNELAQLGMAIEIIDHQFNVLYSQISSSLTYLKDYTKKNVHAQERYEELRLAVEHLETNHKLLTPLFRTTRRVRTDISGSDIAATLKKFFKRTFEEQNITLIIDPSFENLHYFTFESVITPVYINIINNATYWLSTKTDKKIEIYADDDKVFVRNNGEGINEADLEDIFTLFFSRRPGGRGIGLYLAKTNLNTIGYDIFATNNPEILKEGGACFVIEKREEGKK